MSMKTTTEIKVYEENDEELVVGKGQTLTVESHQNSGKRVILVLGADGEVKGLRRITVIGTDLERAIRNATT